jgi:hypothetical protein
MDKINISCCILIYSIVAVIEPIVYIIVRKGLEFSDVIDVLHFIYIIIHGGMLVLSSINKYKEKNE